MSKTKSVIILAEKFMPKIISLIGNEIEFSKQLQDKFEFRISTAQEGQLAEMSVPRLIGLAHTGNNIAKDFLGFIDDLCFKIYVELNENMKVSFLLSIKKLLLEFRNKEENKPTPAYLNWVAEFLVIDKFVNSPDHCLINFETKMENGKCADFEILDSTKSTILIDVVNIHINTKDCQAIYRTIKRKLNSKLNSKFGKLSLNGKYLLPVMWFDKELHNCIVDTLKKMDLVSMHILPPCMLFYSPENIKKSYLSTIEILPKQ